MFRIIICIAMLYLPTTTFAQSKAIEGFYNKYKSQEDISKVELKGWVLKLAAKFADEDNAGDFVRKVTKLRLLNMENGNLVSRSEYNRLVKSVQSDRFEDLMQIREDGDDIRIMIREKGSAVTDVLVLITGQDGFTMLSLEGKLRFKDIQQLNIDIDGAEHFEKVSEKRSSKPTPRA